MTAEKRPYIIWVFAKGQKKKGKKLIPVGYAYCLWNPEQSYKEARLPSAGSFLWAGAPTARRAALDALLLPETEQVSIRTNQDKRIATLYKSRLADYFGQLKLPLTA